jgi:hypothetical protein
MRLLPLDTLNAMSPEGRIISSLLLACKHFSIINHKNVVFLCYLNCLIC